MQVCEKIILTLVSFPKIVFPLYCFQKQKYYKCIFHLEWTSVYTASQQVLNVCVLAMFHIEEN